MKREWYNRKSMKLNYFKGFSSLFFQILVFCFPFNLYAYTISGVVTHEFQNTPIANYRIDLCKKIGPIPNLFTYTNADGSYIIENVPADKYYIHAGNQFEDYENRKLLFNEMYYPNSSSIEEATLLTVHKDIIDINFTLSGRYIVGAVTDELNDSLSAQTVRLYNQDWEEISGSNTNLRGEYFFGCLEPGKYYIGWMGIQYKTQYYNLVSDKEKATVIDLENVVGLDSIDLVLNNGLTIKGKVTNSQGLPIANTHVGMLSESAMDWWNYGIPERADYTDENGNYTISGISPGTYFLVASGIVIVSENPYEESQIYTPIFYNNVLKPEEATSITILHNQTGYDFALKTGYSILGKAIQDEDETPIISACIFLNHTDGEYLNLKSTDNNGEFCFNALSPGDYVVYSRGELSDFQGQQIYQPLYYENATTLESATIIHLTNDDVTDIVLRLKKTVGENSGLNKIDADQTMMIQNYPNPFSLTTTLSYKIEKAGKVKIKIYNSNGELVQTLVNKFQDCGSYKEYFSGSTLSSGVYFYQLEVNGYKNGFKKFSFIK